MRLLDGLHAVWLRRTWVLRDSRGHRSNRSERWKFVAYLAWRPGTDADAMWRADTEAVYKQRKLLIE